MAFNNATFHYPGRESTAALCQLNLEIPQGEFTAVAGLNGCGKSTLCHLVNGLLLPTQGMVLSGGMDTRVERNLPGIRRQVGLIMQNPDNQLIGPTVEDDVAFSLENLAIPRSEMQARVEEALEAMDLADLRHREPQLLSVGEKKRLAVAGALAMRPCILVSDESTSMLDPRTGQEILELFTHLRDEEGMTIIHTTHRPEEIMIADRVALLACGHLLFFGQPDELFERGEMAAQEGLQAPDLFLLARELETRGFPMPRRPLQAMEVVEHL